MQRGRIGAAVEGLDRDRDVVRACLRVLHENVEVTLFVENAGVENLELGRSAPAPPVLFHQMRVGKLGLGIFVEALHVGVGRVRIDIELLILEVLAVIAFWSQKPKRHPSR
jgi:hypothetical protein